MATSLEKLDGMKAELLGPPGPEADGVELALRTVVMIGAPLLEEILPQDPDIMDSALEAIAGKLLELRSDTATELQVAPARLGLLEPSE